MQKREFIAMVAEKTGFTKRDNERVMDAVFQTLGEILADGERLVVRDFGTFGVKQRAPRMARNPRTGQVIPLPGVRVVALKPAQVLKDRLADSAPSQRLRNREV